MRRCHQQLRPLRGRGLLHPEAAVRRRAQTEARAWQTDSQTSHERKSWRAVHVKRTCQIVP